MKKTIAILIFIFALAGTGYRWLQIFPYPIGTGEEAKSPNGKYTAQITQYYDETFLGSSRSWVELEIKDMNEKRINFWETTPIPEAFFGSRTDTEVIFWADNSQNVRFTFPTTEITLNAK
jgi:hypothetical protein